MLESDKQCFSRTDVGFHQQLHQNEGDNIIYALLSWKRATHMLLHAMLLFQDCCSTFKQLTCPFHFTGRGDLSQAGGSSVISIYCLNDVKVVQTSWRCLQGLFDSLEAPEPMTRMAFWGSPHIQEGEEGKPSAAPPSLGRTSIAVCSFGLPWGRSGKQGSAVTALQPGPSVRWATPIQCTGRSYQHRGPLSPAAPVLGRRRSGRPGSASASQGPIPGSRNAGPGASWRCNHMPWCSLAPGVLTSRRQVGALYFILHAASTFLLLISRKGCSSFWVSEVFYCSRFVTSGEFIISGNLSSGFCWIKKIDKKQCSDWSSVKTLLCFNFFPAVQHASLVDRGAALGEIRKRKTGSVKEATCFTHFTSPDLTRPMLSSVSKWKALFLFSFRYCHSWNIKPYCRIQHKISLYFLTPSALSPLSPPSLSPSVALALRFFLFSFFFFFLTPPSPGLFRHVQTCTGDQRKDSCGSKVSLQLTGGRSYLGSKFSHWRNITPRFRWRRYINANPY